jgi:hypothetical protein
MSKILVSSRKAALRSASQERTAAATAARDGELHDTLEEDMVFFFACSLFSFRISISLPRFAEF